MTDHALLDTLATLKEPRHAVRHAAWQRVTATRPGRFVLGTDERLFDPYRHAHAGQAKLESLDDREIDWDYRLDDETRRAVRALAIGRMVTEWEGSIYELVHLSYPGEFGGATSHWLLVADDERKASRYFRAVCEHNAEVRGEVLVFANGCWNRSESLYASIQGTSWDGLILPDAAAAQLRDDFDRFLSSRARYESWRIPWKRGALFLGPPGNGKTLTIRTLVKHLGLPCLYVQTFAARDVPEQTTMREVFQRARRTAPCVMVLEDLDSLVTPQTRSFFLNELDGFATNDGLIVIASTNHPAQLDPAIVDRPSRFDRKYHFGLPAAAERRRYALMWNARLGAELRVDDAALDAVAEATDGFSFAYLKELFAASLMRFAGEDAPQPLSKVLVEEIATLREQMTTTVVVPDGGDRPAVGGDRELWARRHRR